MDVTTTLRKAVSGLSFESIASAMDFSNISSYPPYRAEYDAFVKKAGLEGTAFVPMADHSIGERGWNFLEGREPAYYEEECFNGGWHLVTDEDADYLYCASATSGSFLMAEKDYDGTWKLTLEVPVEDDGQPYKGAYWDAFHRVVEGSTEAAAA